MDNQIYRIPSDGLEIIAETCGQGPPLVFAHGLTGNRHVTLKRLASLAGMYQLVAYDQRGHNQSTSVTDPALYDVDRMAGDMAAVMDALDIPSAIVGGESMGAATTLAFALCWPQRIDKLLLTAPAFGDKPNQATEMIRDMGKAIAELGMETYLARAAVRQRDELGWPEAVIETVAALQGSHDSLSIAMACQTVIDWMPFPDLLRLARLIMPVCFIAWPDDPLHPLALAQRLATIFPNAHLETIPPLPDLFLHPERIGAIYGRFLAVKQ